MDIDTKAIRENMTQGKLTLAYGGLDDIEIKTKDEFLRFCGECWDLTGEERGEHLYVIYGEDEIGEVVVSIVGNGPRSGWNAAAIEKLPELFDALDTARAEVERLTTKVKELRCIGGHKQADLLEYRNRWTQAAAEKKKMREALQMIAEACDSPYPPAIDDASQEICDAYDTDMDAIKALAKSGLKETT
jgi:hypothetical protein